MIDAPRGPLGFGRRLFALRTARKLSQNALALELKCSQPSVKDWEIGRFYPGYWSLIEIAKYFAVDLDWLVGMDALQSD